MRRWAWLVVALVACGGEDEPTATPILPGDSPSTSSGNNPPPPPEDDAVLDFDDPTAPPPALAPSLVALTYVGGAGDQYARAAAFDDAGNLTVEGEGWSVAWSAADLSSGGVGVLDGDVATAGEATPKRPSLPGNPGRAYEDPRIGLTFTVGFRQAGMLQMPIFRAFDGDERIWALWGHPVASAQDASLTADTRCYRAWGMPAGRIGVQCWTDGGNSVLARDPHDLSQGPGWTGGAWQEGTGGMSSMLALVDPEGGGSVVSGTFLNSHVAHSTVDAWGRVYLGQVATSRDGGSEPTDAFGLGASGGAGLLVIDEALQQPLFNARVGGTCEGGEQYFSTVLERDGWLVLAGTTCAADLATTNAVQPAPGGGQDAMIAIVRLWEDPS